MNKQGPKTYNIYVRRSMGTNRLRLKPAVCEKEFVAGGERCFVHRSSTWGDEFGLDYTASHIRTGLGISYFWGTIERAVEEAKKRIAEDPDGFRRGIVKNLKARRAANPVKRASSNGRTSAFQADDPGSSPGARSKNPKGGKA